MATTIQTQEMIPASRFLMSGCGVCGDWREAILREHVWLIRRPEQIICLLRNSTLGPHYMVANYEVGPHTCFNEVNYNADSVF